MAMVYTYLITQKEYNHEYAKKEGLHKEHLSEIYSVEEAYDEKVWYFLNQENMSTNLAKRISFANIAANYQYDEYGHELPDKLYDEFMEVEDLGYEDNDVYRTYRCKVKTTLEPKEFRVTLHPRIINSTRDLLAGLYNITGVTAVEIELEGGLAAYEHTWEKVSNTPVVIGDKAYFQMKCKKSGKEVLKEIEIMK